MAKIPILPKMTTKLSSMLLKNSSNWREIHTEDVNKISENFSLLVRFSKNNFYRKIRNYFQRNQKYFRICRANSNIWNANFGDKIQTRHFNSNPEWSLAEQNTFHSRNLSVISHVWKIEFGIWKSSWSGIRTNVKFLFQYQQWKS